MGAIREALRQQADACRDAVRLVRDARGHSEAQERTVRCTEEAVAELSREATSLRERIRRFRI